jgi:hypothetical protein
MHADLAKAVFQRWDAGLPVPEGTLYKAAEAVGIDPMSALLEARFFTHLDRGLLKMASGQVPSKEEVQFILAGAGWDQLEKTASAYSLPPLPLALRTLEGRGWVPELEKIALMMGAPEEMEGMDPEAAMLMGQDPSGGQMPPEMGPQPGAQVQQQPQARLRPTPTAPLQMAASPEGNIDSILAEAAAMQQAQQGQDGGQPGAAGGEGVGGQGGMPMGGEPMPEGAQGGPSPEEKLTQVAPNLDPRLIPRYAQALQQVEDQVGQPVQDPKQIMKLIEALQKADSKMIDQAIKDVAEQQAQQAQSQTLGAPKPFGTPAGATAGPKPPGGGGGGQSPAPQESLPPEAMSKVARAAGILAHMRYLPISVGR